MWGNHDVQYAFPANKSLRCSGFSIDKCVEIMEIVPRAAWQYTMFTVNIGKYVLSHAGISETLGREEDATRPHDEAAVALASMRECLPETPYLYVGAARGGGHACGGPLWCDWDHEFVPRSVYKQIVGHTPHKEVKEKDGNYDLDTHLRHYGLLEQETGGEYRGTELFDGKLTVMKV